MVALCNYEILSTVIGEEVGIANEEYTVVPATERSLPASLFTLARIQFKANKAVSIKVEYSTNGGSSWSALVGEVTSAADVTIVGSWETIPLGARLAGEVLTRCQMYSPNGTFTLYNLTLQVQ